MSKGSGTLLAHFVGLVAVACSSGGGEVGMEVGERMVELEPATVHIVNLNVLHGNPLGSPCDPGDQCGAVDRIDLLSSHIARADCPEIVTLQEVDELIEELLTAEVPDLCDGSYDMRILPDPAVSLGIDREVVLTSLEVVDEVLLDLPAFPWSAHHVALESPLGPLDLVTTHLASGANNPGCAEADCMPPCADDDDARTCGARLILDHLDTEGGEGLHLVTGDFNAEPGDPAHQLALDAGFVDAHVAAGNPECGPRQPSSCTSGRSESDLGDPSATSGTRIDYILVRDSTTCVAVFDPDLTGGWANEPVEPTGASGVVWVSDHDGVQAGISCG